MMGLIVASTTGPFIGEVRLGAIVAGPHNKLVGYMMHHRTMGIGLLDSVSGQ